MTRAQQTPPLDAAVAEWLRAYWAMLKVEAGFVRGDSPSVSAYQFLLGPKLEERVIAIGKNEAVGKHFATVADLAEFLDNAVVDLLPHDLSADLDLPQLAVELTRRITDPLRRFQFRVPFATARGLPFSSKIGGPHELVLEAAAVEAVSMTPSMTLAGVVDAPTVPAAMAIIEHDVETILGASIALDLCAMLVPEAGSVSDLRAEFLPAEDPEATRLRADVCGAIQGANFHVPEIPGSFGDLQRRRLESGDLEGGLGWQHRTLQRLMGGEEERDVVLRQACALVLRASVAADVGLALTYGFMCLEGLLLERREKENVVARLLEAVVYRLGTSASERSDLRVKLKKLYEIRSKYAHTGSVGSDTWNRPRAQMLDIVACVLRKELTGDRA